MSQPFLPANTYENVYLIVLDAAGYSTFVRFNPRDQAARIFDLLRERIVARLDAVATEHRCARHELWSWHGDGGIFTIHDDNESTTRDVTLTTARDILRLDVAHTRSELRRLALTGDLRLRLAVHKGTLRFSPNGRIGAIHSPEINFAAHLQEATPPDCLAVSEPVYQTAGPYRVHFTPVGTFEDHPIYLSTPTASPDDARRAWLTTTGLAGSHPVFSLPQRPSQAEKVRLITAARSDIVDLGTALRTSARYLTTTERPALYRDAVLHFLARGGTYRCILLDPTCQATAILSDYCQEDLPVKIRASITEFAAFKHRYGSAADNLHVYQSQGFPGFAAIAIDIASPDPLILYSNYLMEMPSLSARVEHADTPHGLAKYDPDAIGKRYTELIRLIVAHESLERIH